MLSYLLIIFIVFLALAPLTHFLPSKRQRQLARMREAAALDGLYVEFRQLPGPAQRLPERPGDMIYYGLRLPAAAADGLQTGHWVRDADDWRAGQRPYRTPEILQDLPLDVLAAGVDSGSCGVYWKESSNEEDVAAISEVLHRWRQQLTGGDGGLE